MFEEQREGRRVHNTAEALKLPQVNGPPAVRDQKQACIPDGGEGGRDWSSLEY